VPLLRAAPRYPQEALESRTEGWVPVERRAPDHRILVRSLVLSLETGRRDAAVH
jgi:hypothetical protein